MTPFGIDALIWPTTAIFIVTLCVSLRFTESLALSIFAALAKAGIYVTYFGFIFDGVYTFFDDWTYLVVGLKLLHQNITITNLIDTMELILPKNSGNHVVYYLHNLYALHLFGKGYFAPVALNILLTAGIAYWGARLASVEFSMSKKATKLFFLFLLLHPDILAWSTVMNGKDILVLLLHVLLLTAASLYLRGKLPKAIQLAAPVILVLFFLRFYVPLLFAMALMASNVLADRRNRAGYLLVSTAVLVLMALLTGKDSLQVAINVIIDDFVNPLYGIVRFSLTPIPFNTDENYAFLNLPSFLHWLWFPFVVLGFIHVGRVGTQFSKFFLLYTMVFIALYAMYAELQGPRHRVQMDYAFALLQFLGSMVAFKKLTTRIKDYRRRPKNNL